MPDPIISKDDSEYGFYNPESQQINNPLDLPPIGFYDFDALYENEPQHEFGSKTAEANNLTVPTANYNNHKSTVNEASIVPDFMGPNDNFRAFTNILRNPVAGTVDNLMYLADVAGAPTSLTNIVRGVNANIPYRVSSGIRALANTLMNNKTYRENFYDALANPSWYERLFTIRPLAVTNSSYTDEELEAIKRLAGKKQRITANDYKRSKTGDGHYLSPSSGLAPYFTHKYPEKVVELSLGQASGGNGYITDVYDQNTQSSGAKADTKTYQDRAYKDFKNRDFKSLSYSLPRSISSYLLPLDIMPDEYKIHTRINLNNIP